MCLKDSETLAFSFPVAKHHDSALDSVRLYVQFGVLMLPSEKSKAPR